MVTRDRLARRYTFDLFVQYRVYLACSDGGGSSGTTEGTGTGTGAGAVELVGSESLDRLLAKG